MGRGYHSTLGLDLRAADTTAPIPGTTVVLFYTMVLYAPYSEHDPTLFKNNSAFLAVLGTIHKQTEGQRTNGHAPFQPSVRSCDREDAVTRQLYFCLFLPWLLEISSGDNRNATASSFRWPSPSPWP